MFKDPFDSKALLGRQFSKDKVAEVVTLVNELFERDSKEKSENPVAAERAFEPYSRPSRKNLH
mgnify:CR=1 FL=1